MSQRRTQTNLTDASQSSSADSQFDQNSMAAQDPSSPRPMTRSWLRQVQDNAPEGVTADSLRTVNDNGERQFDSLLSGMLTAADPDASSVTSPGSPSPSEHNADDTTPRPTRPKGDKHLRIEMDGMEATEESHSRRLKQPRIEQEIEKYDKCFGRNGQSSRTATEADNVAEQDDRADHEHETTVNRHLGDDNNGSREQTPKTPSSSGGDDEGST